MNSLSDKVSYLRGLAEGMKLNTEENTGKLLSQVIEVLGDVAERIGTLEEGYEELSDYVECIDDDLEALEVRADEEDEDFDDDDFDDDEDEDDDDDDVCTCGHCHDDEDDDDDEDEDDAFGMYAGCLCSECGGMFSVDVNTDDGQLFICPHCGKRVKAVAMNCQNVPVADTFEEDETSGKDKDDE